MLAQFFQMPSGGEHSELLKCHLTIANRLPVHVRGVPLKS